jgi:AsmA protein
MKIILKIFGTFALLVVILAVGVAFFIGLVFDPNDYKGYVEDLVESRSGRDFLIEDDLELTFFPVLGVETGRLQLGNIEGFGDEPFATADRALLGVKILPLLFARVELGSLELDGLRLNLTRDTQERGNWEDLLDRGQSADNTESSPNQAVDNNSLSEHSIEGIVISDGLIFFREDITEVQYIVSELSLATGPVLIGQPVQTELSFQLVSIEPQFSAQFTATASALVNPQTSRYLIEDLQLGFQMEDGRHTERLAGSIATTISLAADERRLSLSDTQLESVLNDPPFGPESVQLGATWAGLEIDLSAGTMVFDDLSTNGNGILAEWDLTARNILDSPELTGTVEISDQSLDAAFKLINFPLETDVDTDSLGNFDLNTGFVFRVENRELIVERAELAALDFQLSGDLNINAAGDASGQLNIPVFDPRAALALVPTNAAAQIDFGIVDTLSIAAEFATDGPQRRLRIGNIQAETMGTSITGLVDVFRAERRYEGRISTSEIDPVILSQLLPNLFTEGSPTERLGPVRASSNFAYDSVTQELALNSMDAEVLGLLATGQLTVVDVTESPRLTGNLSLQPFNPRDLFQRFELPPRQTADTSVLSRAIVDVHIDITEERGIFEDIALQLDDSSITGKLTVQNFLNPEYAFSLNIDAIDVDRYLPPRTAAESDTPPEQRPVELPTAAMQELALDGNVSVGALTLGGMPFTNVSTLLASNGGIGSIESARANLFGGEIEGEVKLDAQGSVPELTVAGTVLGVELDPLLTALRGESMLSGTGNFDIELIGRGSGLDESLATTSGRVDFALRDGVIRGFDLGHSLCDVYSQLEKLPGPTEAAAGHTAYQFLRGNSVVTEGIAQTGNLQAATSFMELSGGGQIDLTTQDIRYDVVAKLVNGIEIGGCQAMDALIGDSIPVNLTGNVAEPAISPDFRQIIRDRAREAVQEEVGDLLRNRLEDLLNR